MNSNLPIELVPGNTPPRFRWQHTTSTPVGERTVECEGLAPTSMERALTDLINLCERQAQEMGALEGMRVEDQKRLQVLQEENQGLAAQLMNCQDRVEKQNQEIADVHRQKNALEVLNTNQKVMLDQAMAQRPAMQKAAPPQPPQKAK